MQADAESTAPDKRSIWHASPCTDVLLALGSAPDGLDQAEVSRRLELHGPNRLAEAPPPGLLARLVRQFNNLLLIVLMVAAVVTVAIGHWIDG
ncbi:MAG: cation-transporting P-type ATPase, partial [Rubrivivax sp.]|nr:cation-transporting P-type ATPase [Rubrivivax sp.]